MIWLLLLSACVVEEWRNADLHVDVTGADWTDTDTVRLCVAGVGPQEEALGAGRVGYPGIPTDGAPRSLIIDLMDPDPDTDDRRLGRAGPIALTTDTPWQEVAMVSCDTEPCGGCTAQGERADPDDLSWLLAVRFR